MRGGSLDYEDEVRAQHHYVVFDDNSYGFCSAWEYIGNNPTDWYCPDQCPPSTVDFTAQTAVASSYGLMQLMWPSTIAYGANWNSGNAGDPHELHNPRLNLTLASRILRYHIERVGWSGYLDTYGLAVDSVLVRYNRDPNYPYDVRQWLGDYQTIWSEE